jgi:hypothetical protein
MSNAGRKPLIRPQGQETRPRRGWSDYVWLAVTSPITLNFRLFSVVYRRLVRPFSPQLIPFATALLLFPVLAFLSLFAGFYVWKHAAVGWDSLLFLQYG